MLAITLSSLPLTAWPTSIQITWDCTILSSTIRMTKCPFTTCLISEGELSTHKRQSRLGLTTSFSTGSFTTIPKTKPLLLLTLPSFHG
ncbi:hypothetical protein EV127DRAFT_427165 [Xylaria flabelliformis]|nr:hypothetical protein EV127DRAFT_427165 [Xylaria flabelliformis]